MLRSTLQRLGLLRPCHTCDSTGIVLHLDRRTGAPAFLVPCDCRKGRRLDLAIARARTAKMERRPRSAFPLAAAPTRADLDRVRDATEGRR